MVSPNLTNQPNAALSNKANGEPWAAETALLSARHNSKSLAMKIKRCSPLFALLALAVLSPRLALSVRAQDNYDQNHKPDDDHRDQSDQDKARQEQKEKEERDQQALREKEQRDKDQHDKDQHDQDHKDDSHPDDDHPKG